MKNERMLNNQSARSRIDESQKRTAKAIIIDRTFHVIQSNLKMFFCCVKLKFNELCIVECWVDDVEVRFRIAFVERGLGFVLWWKSVWIIFIRVLLRFAFAERRVFHVRIVNLRENTIIFDVKNISYDDWEWRKWKEIDKSRTDFCGCEVMNRRKFKRKRSNDRICANDVKTWLRIVLEERIKKVRELNRNVNCVEE